MKKYIHNRSITYQMWPVMYDLEVTRWRVVRFENNEIKYERIFDSEKQASIYINENESI